MMHEKVKKKKKGGIQKIRSTTVKNYMLVWLTKGHLSTVISFSPYILFCQACKCATYCLN